MSKLYQFSYYGGSASLKGLLVLTDEEKASLIGQKFDFGEASGKHSVVIIIMTDKNLIPLDVNEDFINQFKTLFPNGFGYNPIHYLIDSEECET